MNINNVFQIVIENWKEEFEVIEETTFLEDAVIIAKNYPIEKYKSIEIDQLNEKGFIEKRFDENGEEI